MADEELQFLRDSHVEALSEMTDFVMKLGERHGWDLPEIMGVVEFWKVDFIRHVSEWDRDKRNRDQST